MFKERGGGIMPMDLSQLGHTEKRPKAKQQPPIPVLLKNTAVAFFGCVAVSMMFLSGAWGAASPTEAVKETVDKVLVVLRNHELKKPARESERRAKLEEIIGRRFDYTEMAKRTLASQWKQLTPDQQQEFVNLFQQFLANSYAGNVDGYSGEKVEYLNERERGNFAEVQTKVVSPKVQIPLDYRLLKKNGEWRVYDVIIDGVSLMKNYRGQFSRIINSSSFEGLLDKLRSKADLETSS